ncbi:MAG: energy-coupling factor transporter ATPase [Firmicutes bacterium]|nr:energy-coupling factor transporter ATPase [Bacillota bacterium]
MSNNELTNTSDTPILRTENLCHVYQPGTPFEFAALNNVNIEIKKGEMAGIIGPTGSGKSTLVQHFNGLLKPTSGRVLVENQDINKREKKKRDKKSKDSEKPVCFKVGLVFQFPEYQLFEETVFEDIAFGPRNMELSPDEVNKRVYEAMEWMKIDAENMKDRSPFSLSGGEMRRVALAGVLAMQPSVLVLDEPTAGLDPRGCSELRDILRRLHSELNITLIMITHEMQEIARMVDHLIIMNKGEVYADGAPAEIFSNKEKIEALELGIPPAMELLNRLQQKGFNLKTNITGMEEAADEILKALK